MWQKEAAWEQSAFYSRFQDLSRACRAPFARGRRADHGEQSALSPETGEPITGNYRLFTVVTENKSARESRFPARVGPGFWRTIRAHVACRAPAPFARSPSPSPSPARRGKRARVLPSSSHPHLQEHGEHPTI
jgi:hypothetical protein